MNNKNRLSFEFEYMEDSYIEFMDGKRAAGCFQLTFFIIACIAAGIITIYLLYK